MAADWLLNEKNRSDFETVGSKVTFKHTPDQCNYYNAMYLGLCANEKNKKYFWEFTCTGSRCSVGIAKKGSFADGYKISGVYFNGNLTDGGCFLVGEFGDSIEAGDRIGFILDATETELKIYILQNDRPLGLAFVHSAPYSNELHPTVSFSSPGTVEIKEKKLENIDNLLTRTDYINKTIDGKYKLISALENNVQKELPNYVLSLKGDNGNNDRINLGIKIINHIGCVLTKKGEDNWDVEGLMSTLMAGHPEEMQNESYLSGVIHSLKTIKFSENLDEVTISAPNTTLIFKRFLPEKTPFKTSTLLK